MRSLTNRVCILTGASGGIGAVVARRLAAAGVQLALVARSADRLAVLARELSDQQTTAWVFPADVTDRQSLEALVEGVMSTTGRIDLLINNAGVETFQHFHETPLDDIEQVVAVNLTAPLMLSRLVIPRMLAGDGGHIVNMSSIVGMVGTSYSAVYGATKAALVNATTSLRAEYRARGVSASVILPGFVHGGMHELHKQQAGAAPVMVGSTDRSSGPGGGTTWRRFR